jgi:hypothetical protein
MVTADHKPRRNDGGPLGQRFSPLGSEVVGDYPKLTWRTPMHRGTTTACEGASGIEGLAEGTSNQARCTVFGTGLLWWQGVAGCAMQGIDKWHVINTSAGGGKQQHSGQLLHQQPIPCTLVVLATDKWDMPVMLRTESIYLQRGEGARSMPDEPKSEYGMLPRRRSPPLLVGGREMTKLVRKDGPSLVMALPPLWKWARVPMTLGNQVKLPVLVAAYNQPMEYFPPSCLQRAQNIEGNAILLMPQRTWVRVPSTRTSDRVVLLLDISPPCCDEGSVPLGPPMAPCSPVGDKRRLVPTTWVSLLTAETV